MRLLAIYNVWSDWDILEHSIENIRPLVDDVLIIGSEYSNSGEFCAIPDWAFERYLIVYEPTGSNSQEKERAKRNYGLNLERFEGFTHFLMMDADEFYEPEPFLKEKERFKNPDLLGLVCGLKCYFRLPTLTVPDHTLVPFIHKLTPDIKCTFNHDYPFAFTGPKREIRIDPTRQFNISSGVEWSEITMHHYSWIRSDIQKKIRNSTARHNIEQSTIVQDYLNAKPGYYCEYYKATIESCENLFNIPIDLVDHELIRLHEQEVKETKPSSSGSDTSTEGLL